MRYAVLLSGLLHAALVAVMLFGLAYLKEQDPFENAVLVELVYEEPEADLLPEPEPEVVEEVEPEVLEEPDPEIAEKAEPEVVEESEPEIAEEIETEPLEEPAPEIVEDAEPEVLEEPEPEIVEQIEPETQEASEPEPEIAEAAEPVSPFTAPPLPIAKPALPLAAATPESLVPEQESLAQEEAGDSVEPEPEQPEVAEAEVKTKKPPEAQPPAPYTSQDQIGSVSAGQLLARLEQIRDPTTQAKENPELWKIRQAFCRQMVKCWRVDARNPPSHKFSVDIKVAFDPQGSLQVAQIEEVGRMVQDASFNMFVRDARTALQNCSPFDLPPEHYNLWRQFSMRFVPNLPAPGWCQVEN